MRMFKRNRYTTLTETLSLLEDRLSECDPEVDKNQVQYLRSEIDEVRTEILKIEIKSIKGEWNVQTNQDSKCCLWDGTRYRKEEKEKDRKTIWRVCESRMEKTLEMMPKASLL